MARRGGARLERGERVRVEMMELLRLQLQREDQLDPRHAAVEKPARRRRRRNMKMGMKIEPPTANYLTSQLASVHIISTITSTPSADQIRPLPRSADSAAPKRRKLTVEREREKGRRWRIHKALFLPFFLSFFLSFFLALN